MKCFTITSMHLVTPGIAITGGRVSLGESGRGRTRVFVPAVGLPADDRIERATPARTSEGHVVLVPERDPNDPRVLLLFVGDPGYSRGAEYRVPTHPKLTLLAEGWGAYGDAGRLGGWQEALVIAEPSVRVELRTKYRRVVLIYDTEPIILSEEDVAALDAAAAAAAGQVEPL